MHIWCVVSLSTFTSCAVFGPACWANLALLWIKLLELHDDKDLEIFVFKMKSKSKRIANGWYMMHEEGLNQYVMCEFYRTVSEIFEFVNQWGVSWLMKYSWLMNLFSYPENLLISLKPYTRRERWNFPFKICVRNIIRIPPLLPSPNTRVKNHVVTFLPYIFTYLFCLLRNTILGFLEKITS